MERLPWKDYEGETAQALIALKGRFRTDSLVCAFEEAIQRKPDSTLSRPERVVLAVESLEREVNNGGFSQFFVNSSSEFVPTISQALQEAGCPSTAAIVDGAIAVLGLQASFSSEDVPDAVTPEVEEELEAFDELFLAYPDPIEDRLLDYIEHHLDEIQIS